MPSPTRIVTAKPPRKRTPAKQTATISVPRVVKNRPTKEIERDRKSRELQELLTEEPTVRPDIQAAMAAELAKAAEEAKQLLAKKKA